MNQESNQNPTFGVILNRNLDSFSITIHDSYYDSLNHDLQKWLNRAGHWPGNTAVDIRFLPHHFREIRTSDRQLFLEHKLKPEKLQKEQKEGYLDVHVVDMPICDTVDDGFWLHDDA